MANLTGANSLGKEQAPVCRLALSIRQPFAWLIVNGFKDIENRGWRTSYRGRVLIHAGRMPDGPYPAMYRYLYRVWPEAGLTTEAWFRMWEVFHGKDGHYGAIVGEADLVDCVEESDSPWFLGPYGLVFANPMAYEKPIPYPGRLKLFEVKLEESIHAEI